MCLLFPSSQKKRERERERERRHARARAHDAHTRSTKNKNKMTAPCERCGYAMRLLAASPTISCSSCNASHSTEKVFNDAKTTTTKTSSNAASFLYKFNIEPRNPDGTKIGSERHDDDVERERATVDEPCPKCPNQVLRFYTMQLRSADEGQTVFYECEKCKHTFSQNN